MGTREERIYSMIQTCRVNREEKPRSRASQLDEDDKTKEGSNEKNQQKLSIKVMTTS